MIPKISVAIITYNQEHLIGRALDSVLKQKEYIYEIIISDDCSTDNNWQVIMDYYYRYSDLIKPFRQEINLGINRNQEFIWTKPCGNIVIQLSGDDELCEGVLKAAIDKVNAENIDVLNDNFVIYTDYETILPDGSRKRISNYLIEKNYNPISLKIRNLICNRTTLVSISVYKKFHLSRPDLGIFSDGLIDIQTQIYANKNYYIPIIGSIYYAGIGVSANYDRQDYYTTRIEANNEMEKTLNLDGKDKNYIKYLNHYLMFCMNPSMGRFFKTWKYHLKSIYIKEELNLLRLFRRLISMLIRFIKN
ncbi:MAG: glycosyltransferase [Firmicutes bacterium]|nr:glycosyltransferase [Bacillota bacterium]